MHMLSYLLLPQPVCDSVLAPEVWRCHLSSVLSHRRTFVHSSFSSVRRHCLSCVQARTGPASVHELNINICCRALQGGAHSQAAGLSIPVRINQLDFAVDQYIAIGSPLGLFLALRKVKCII